MPLTAFLESQRAASDRAIERVLLQVPADSRVGAAVRYALEGGGKRIRPALSAACYEAVAGRATDDAVADLAGAVELIHTYSLIHDDLPCMDDDDVRRGRATTHRVFGDEIAALAGAAIIPLAFRVAAEAAVTLGLDGLARRQVARTLAGAAGAAGMVGGQVLDLESEAFLTDVAQLERVHGAKTSALLRGACRIGAIAGRADPAKLDAIDAYARHLGLAFQITDDVLDETASSEQLGKTAGKDRSGAKATFPALLGLPAAVERAATEVSTALAALGEAGLLTDTLAYLGRFAVERKH